MLMGGEAFATRRYVFWNFVSSSRDRINQAKEEWKALRFPLIPGDDEEYIPLPEVPIRSAIREAVAARAFVHSCSGVRDGHAFARRSWIFQPGRVRRDTRVDGVDVSVVRTIDARRPAAEIEFAMVGLQASIAGG